MLFLGSMATSNLARLANESRTDYAIEVFFTQLTTDSEAQEIMNEIKSMDRVRKGF